MKRRKKLRGMSLLQIAVEKLDLCEGGSFSTAIFNSDIQLRVFLLFVFYICLSVCRFIKGNIRRSKMCTLFCLVDIKKHSTIIHWTLTWTTGSLTCVHHHSYKMRVHTRLGWAHWRVSTFFIWKNSKMFVLQTGFKPLVSGSRVHALPIEPPTHPPQKYGQPSAKGGR